MKALNPAPALLRVLLFLRQQDWLALMLLGLHIALVFDIETPVARAFLLFHFGCFLLWQPVWRGEQKVYLSQAVLIIGAAAVLVASGSWWLMALWLSVLFALIGGEVPGLKNTGQRIVSLIAAGYLLSILLVWVVPHLFETMAFSETSLQLVRFGPMAPLTLILLIKAERPNPGTTFVVDLIYSLLLFLMVVALVLGALVIRQASHGNYVVALAQALLVIGGILVALSWLWDPRGGFEGIGHVLTRYVLSVGMPFERWMHGLANLADRERDPDRFLSLAADQMATFPWVQGVDWQGQNNRGLAGRVSRNATECRYASVKLIVYTRWSPSPALVLHVRLLGRLLADYYETKRREQEQRQNVYMQAIYETGSRLTHDVKNLLQSLSSLCAAVETSSEQDAGAVRRLMQRQLPQIMHRLQGTLDKLTQTGRSRQESSLAKDWWRDVQQRYGHEGILFEVSPLPPDARLSVELFDSIADNFLQNALNKRRAHPGIRIRAALAFEGGCAFTVCDSGEPMSDQIARQLFAAPVPSLQGLGVGLYQAARQAKANGYRLMLASNAKGKVCVALLPAEVEADAAIDSASAQGN